MSEFYDREGRPISIQRFGELSRGDYKIVRKTGCRDTADVSTVWLGIDHRYGDDGPPLIFETMIFGGLLDQETRRYSTEKDALQGHDETVRRVFDVEGAFSGLAAQYSESLGEIVTALDCFAAEHEVSVYDDRERIFGELARRVTS